MTMTKRQIYKDATIEEALSHRWNIFQVKYDGLWARIVIEDSRCQIFSRTGKLKTEFDVDPLIRCELVGEYMFGTQRSQNPDLQGYIYVFDCTSIRGEDIRHLPYLERYQRAYRQVLELPEKFRVVCCFRIEDAMQAWQDLEDKEEGFVFRHANDTYNDPLVRVKYEVMEPFYIVDFYQGQGKHHGRLGAIGVARSPGGEEMMRVGGGFNDALRQEIWDQIHNYRNRKVLIKGKGQFESGALRHPNFVSFR